MINWTKIRFKHKLKDTDEYIEIRKLFKFKGKHYFPIRINAFYDEFVEITYREMYQVSDGIFKSTGEVREMILYSELVEILRPQEEEE